MTYNLTIVGLFLKKPFCEIKVVIFSISPISSHTKHYKHVLKIRVPEETKRILCKPPSQRTEQELYSVMIITFY